jgi:2-oxoglutarate ferredoxin oxidoreductase subunit alpha
MSQIRGGNNSTEIVVSFKRTNAFLNRIDLLVPLSKGAVRHVERRLSSKTVILGDSRNLEVADLKNRQVIDVSFLELSSRVGSCLFANIIAAGVVSSLFQIDQNTLNDYLKETFSKKGVEIVWKNVQAAKLSYQIGDNLRKDPKVASGIILNSAEAVGLGALAGGCNFISSYPMSPSTPVLVFLSQQAEEFEIIAEQAEDKISAINMVIGAWYAGARAMVTTSGGGFALMVGGVSLAGMLEILVVIHLAQRPGPATGLPTRTEQADLLFALHAGYGEFPRLIFAPGTLEDAFYFTQLAFNLADKYQIPVFILTDQHLIDSYSNIPSLDFTSVNVEKHFVETSPSYQRY